jgi:hypothetical protein
MATTAINRPIERKKEKKLRFIMTVFASILFVAAADALVLYARLRLRLAGRSPSYIPSSRDPSPVGGELANTEAVHYVLRAVAAGIHPII